MTPSTQRNLREESEVQTLVSEKQQHAFPLISKVQLYSKIQSVLLYIQQT